MRYLLTAAFFAGLFTIWAIDDERSRASGEPPGWGIGAMFVAVLALIALINGVARAERPKKERSERRAGNDVPGWVGYLGPIVRLALAWLAARLGGCALLFG